MRGRVVAAPGTAGGEVGDWKAIPEQSLAALRELQSHESIFDAQRQLAEARLETVAVRRQLLVGDLCRQLGLRRHRRGESIMTMVAFPVCRSLGGFNG